MTEVADYLISDIVDVSTEIDFTQMFIDVGLWGIMFLVLAVVFIIIPMILLEREWEDIPAPCVCGAIVMAFIGCMILMVYAISCLEMPYLEDRLDGLVTAYESLYGPLPEGIL